MIGTARSAGTGPAASAICATAASDAAASAGIGHLRRTATAATQTPIKTHRAGGSRSQTASANQPLITGVAAAP